VTTLMSMPTGCSRMSGAGVATMIDVNPTVGVGAEGWPDIQHFHHGGQPYQPGDDYPPA